MDFLNKAFAQLTDLFRSMTPATRVTTGLLLVAVVVSLGYLFTHETSGPQVDLMNGVPVPPAHIPVMEAAFSKAGLNSYEVRGTQIYVPRGLKEAYMGALADAKAMPPNINTVLEKSIEDTSPFTSQKERDALLKIAKQKMLAMIIGQMQNIDSAYVLYDTEKRGGLRREEITKASVSVKPLGAGQLDDQQVSAIRYLVAGAVASLKPENVTVADLNGGVHHGSPESGGSASDNPYVSLKRIHEQDWRTKILNALSYVPGVTVTADVLLDPQRKQRSTSVKYAPKPVAVSEKDESRESSSEGGGPGGEPGYLANAANRPASVAPSRSRASHNEESQSKREVVSLPDTEQTERERIGLTPTKVSVSIGIPASYFAKVWHEQNPAKEGEEPKEPQKNDLAQVEQEVVGSIRSYVANLLPVAEGVADRTELVDVKTFQDLTPEPLPTPNLTDRAVTWLGQYWMSVGMVGLALLSLLILRSMIRAVPSIMASPTGSKLIGDDEDDELSPEETAARRLSRFTGSGPSLRDELSELVQEDTDTAANILKTWIGNVG